MLDLSYSYFFILALLGAIVANATGAGGGVVFVPAFKMLGVDQASIIATSFAIQCFGMTAGSVAWYKHAQKQDVVNEPAWVEYATLVKLFALPAVLGVIAGQTLFEPSDDLQTLFVFKLFSAAFGAAILITTYQLRRSSKSVLSQEELSALRGNNRVGASYVVTGFVGGVITAWLSIGVGELVAILLILMRFPVVMSVGVAVTVSAIVVWVGVQKHLWFGSAINTNILIFAAPAAIIGGTSARRIATIFTPVQLKVVIAIWVLISAVAM